MRKILTQLLGLIFVLAACPATAQTYKYQTSYDATIMLTCPPGNPGNECANPDGPQVTNIIMLEEGAGFGSGTWAFEASGYGTTTLTNPYLFDLPPESSLLIGLVKALPTDPAANDEHIVLFMHSISANNVAGIPWDSVFTGILESALIQAIKVMTTGLPLPDLTVDAAEQEVTAFSVAAKSGHFGTGGAPASAWFATGGAFKVATWSDGLIIGTGTSTFDQIPINSVAEPATTLLLALGFACMGRKSRHLRSA